MPDVAAIERHDVPFLDVKHTVTDVAHRVPVLGPRAQETATDIENRYQTKLEQQTELQWKRDVNFNNDVAGREWKAGAFGLVTHELLRVNVTWTGPDRIRRVLFATDFSSHSLVAWPYPVSIAQENQARAYSLRSERRADPHCVRDI